MMNLKLVFACLLTAILIAACSGVEMVPAPEPTRAPAQPAATQAPPAAQPPAKETPAAIAPFELTPNPNPDDEVKSGTPDGATLMFQPQPGDAKLQQGQAFVDSSELTTLNNDPKQPALHISGNVPSPCHRLRVNVTPPNKDNRISVEVYTVVNPDMICAQVLAPFDVSVSLGNVPAGKYAVQMNGEKVGDFTMP